MMGSQLAHTCIGCQGQQSPGGLRSCKPRTAAALAVSRGPAALNKKLWTGLHSFMALALRSSALASTSMMCSAAVSTLPGPVCTLMTCRVERPYVGECILMCIDKKSVCTAVLLIGCCLHCLVMRHLLGLPSRCSLEGGVAK